MTCTTRLCSLNPIQLAALIYIRWLNAHLSNIEICFKAVFQRWLPRWKAAEFQKSKGKKPLTLRLRARKAKNCS